MSSLEQTQNQPDMSVSPIRKRAQLNHLAPFVEQIKEADQKVKLYIQHSLKHALRAGQLLSGIKKKVGHGGWLDWFDSAEFEFSERTAQRYMSVYQRWKELEAKVEQGANPTALTDLTFTDALELLSKPDAKPTAKKLSAATNAKSVIDDTPAKPASREKVDLVEPAQIPMATSEPKPDAMAEVVIARRTSSRLMACVKQVLTGGTDSFAIGNKFQILDQRVGQRANWEQSVFVDLSTMPDMAEQMASQLLTAYLEGKVEQAILLAPACTSAEWFRLLRDYVRAFLNGEQLATGNLHEHFVAIYLGRQPDRFYSVFQSIGDVYQPYR